MTTPKHLQRERDNNGKFHRTPKNPPPKGFFNPNAGLSGWVRGMLPPPTEDVPNGQQTKPNTKTTP